eukprot:1945051-Rhodomonas_salina.2
MVMTHLWRWHDAQHGRRRWRLRLDARDRAVCCGQEQEVLELRSLLEECACASAAQVPDQSHCRPCTVRSIPERRIIVFDFAVCFVVEAEALPWWGGDERLKREREGERERRGGGERDEEEREGGVGDSEERSGEET